MDFTRKMMFFGILASTTLMGIADSAALGFTTYGRRELSALDRPELLLLVDQRVPELENEMFVSGNDPASTVIRTKRIGSLSIVNSLDVLRQRVLLELARRKALQDQQQIDMNRDYLNRVGKRSIPSFKDATKFLATRQRNDYAIRQRTENGATENIPEKTQDWLDGNDSAFREGQNDQTHRVQANELRLL